ncbi:hypothetical protein QAD02_009907 [Eretmocerus hayati]|uniref:Uncharacterized protein n=1 Tax=Eretmocerus hayati TaxID=131215 RepID=A0ACC2NAM1_9HYME|nr:hypothetical protein QAD02_009907 [Eretmocerus hayati]
MKLKTKLITPPILKLCIWLWICSISKAEPLHGAPDSLPHVDVGKKDSIALITSDNEIHLCTGSLILKNQVLTAASCLKNIPTQDLRVIFGTTDSSLSVHKKFNVLSKITYEEWCGNQVLCFYEKYTDDLCILKLDVVDTGIKPIIIGGNLDTSFKQIKVAGWGLVSNSFHNTYYPKRPRSAAMETLSKTEYEQRVRSQIPECFSDVVLPNKVVCAVSQPAVLAVEGDFGGPVFVFYQRQISGILIQRCPLSNPLDVNVKQVNLILKLSHFKEFLTDAVSAEIKLYL